MESKEERFARVAEARVNKIIDMLRLLGNLGNRNNYAYTEREVEAIFSTLEEELRTMRLKFADKDRKNAFTLSRGRH